MVSKYYQTAATGNLATIRVGSSRNIKRRSLEVNTPLLLLMALFSAIALQGMLELVTFADYTKISGAVGFGQRVVRLGLYGYFVLTLAWLATHRKDTYKLAPREFALIVFAYIELFIVVIMGALNSGKRSDTTFEDTRQLLELMILIPIVYSSISRTDQICKATNWFTNLLTVIAGLNLLGYLGHFIFPLSVYFRTYFPLVLLFGCTIKWSQILIFGPSLKRIIQFVIVCGGTLITFEKSILVPTLLGLASMVVLLFVSSSQRTLVDQPLKIGRTKTILTIVFIISFASAAAVAANTVTANELFLRYKNDFLYEYLKTDYGYAGLDSNRFIIWQTAWTKIMQNPMLGTGWGFRVNFWYRDNAYIHNSLLYWLGSVGFIGGGVLLFILFIMGRYMSKYLDLSRDADLKIGLGGFLVAVLVFNNTNVLFVEPAFVYVMGVTIALILRVTTLDASDVNNA